MQLDDIVILSTAVGLLSILGANIIFPPFVESTTDEVEVSRWLDTWGVHDQNSTFYEHIPSPDEYDIETQDTLPFRPSGWFNLTVTIPFEIDKNWTKIDTHMIFSATTPGGVWFFWTLKWRLYNSSNVALSDDWSDSFAVSANTPITVDKNIEYNIGRDEKNGSIYTPGQWYYEVTLTVHNTTLLPSALKHGLKYYIYYNLFLEVSQETLLTKTHVKFTRSFYGTITAGVMVALVLGINIIRRTKKFRTASETRILPGSPKRASMLE